MNESVLIDTNIFVEIFRSKDKKLQQMIDGLDRPCINIIVYFEMVRGEPNKKRYAEMEKYLRKYELIHLDIQTSKLAIGLCVNLDLLKVLTSPTPLSPLQQSRTNLIFLR